MTKQLFGDYAMGRIVKEKNLCYNYDGDLKLGKKELVLQSGKAYVYDEAYGDDLVFVSPHNFIGFYNAYDVRAVATQLNFVEIGETFYKWIVSTWGDGTGED